MQIKQKVEFWGKAECNSHQSDCYILAGSVSHEIT